MTLAKQVTEAGFVLDSPPSGGVEALKAWLVAMLTRLQERTAQPQVQVQTFGQLTAVPSPEIAKPVDGMLAYMAANVAGAGKPAGLYLRDAGAWKQVQAI